MRSARLVKHHRCRSVRKTVADKSLLEQILIIKSEHPFWGYRRVWAYLRFVAGLPVNRKRVYRLLKENGLLVRADTRLLAKRVSNTRKPRPERVNQWWGIDMTKVMTRDGWAYVVLVLDWYSKKVVGHYCGEQSKAWHWLAALNKAVNRQFPRKALYFPAITAKRHNEIIKEFAERLHKRGKTPMQIVCAAMRKLLHIAFGVLKHKRAFDASLAFSA